MFFRTKTVKSIPLVQLVESFRNAEGQPRQRVVVSLGDAKLPENEKPLIARTVENNLLGRVELLPPDLSEKAAVWVRRKLGHFTWYYCRLRKASAASKAGSACVPTSTNSNTASKPTSSSACWPTIS